MSGTAAVIAEFNPFHDGHAHLIREARRSGYDRVIALMSGDFVQRGEPAAADRFVRTEMALRGGADLVLAFPTRFATASAETFAASGVRLLDRIGCVDALFFGSECGRLEPLAAVAGVLAEEPDWFRAALSSALREGQSYPAALSSALRKGDHCQEMQLSVPSAGTDGSGFSDTCDITVPSAGTDGSGFSDTCDSTVPSAGTDGYGFSGTCDSTVPSAGIGEPGFPDAEQLLSQPNNILAIEYLKALIRLKSPMRPVTIPRAGRSYRESASEMRRAIAGGKAALRALGAIPPASLDVWERSGSGDTVLSADDFTVLLAGGIWSTDSPETLAEYEDVTPDLAKTILRERIGLRSFLQFAELISSKSVTLAHAKRALLHISLGIKRRSCPPGEDDYARVLGFRKEAGELPAELMRCSRIPVIMNPGRDLRGLSLRQRELIDEEARICGLYETVRAIRYGTAAVRDYSRFLITV